MTMTSSIRMFTKILAMLSVLMLSACGFHFRGEMQLAPALHSLYIQSIDPYGVLVKELEQSLKMSKVTLAATPEQADSVLVISNDSTSQDLLSVGGTQQTRQYKLSVIVVFYINDAKGRTIVEPQMLTESRVITIQSNQVLGSSNEANLYFQQMRRTLASAIMYRLSSHQVTSLMNKGYHVSKQPNV